MWEFPASGELFGEIFKEDASIGGNLSDTGFPSIIFKKKKKKDFDTKYHELMSKM